MLQITSIDDIEACVRNEDFNENHYLEAKRALDLQNKTQKLEFARDVAQFAFDGGVVVYGIGENKQFAEQGEDEEAQFYLSPFDLSSLTVEQIEQVAQGRCEPPLSIRVQRLPSPDDPGTGYIVVTIPPSSRAPHMVDGKYPSRNQSTRSYLNDSAVRIYMQLQHDAKARAESELTKAIANDPASRPDQDSAHIFGVAVPISNWSEMELEQREAQNILGDARARWRDLRQNNWTQRSQRYHVDIEGSLEHADYFRQRGGEWAFQTRHLREELDDAEEYFLAEWSVTDGGIVKVFDAGLSTYHERGGTTIKVAHPGVARDVAGILVTSAGMWARQAGYHGEWAISIGATQLSGARIYTESMFTNPPAADRDKVIKTVLASTYEVQDSTWEVSAGLARRVRAALGDTSE